MGVPGAYDIMLSYQSTSFHDIRYLRSVLKLPPAPEFEEWLQGMGITGEDGELAKIDYKNALVRSLPEFAG